MSSPSSLDAYGIFWLLILGTGLSFHLSREISWYEGNLDGSREDFYDGQARYRPIAIPSLGFEKRQFAPTFAIRFTSLPSGYISNPPDFTCSGVPIYQHSSTPVQIYLTVTGRFSERQ